MTDLSEAKKLAEYRATNKVRFVTAALPRHIAPDDAVLIRVPKNPGYIDLTPPRHVWEGIRSE